jgi:MFS family permease
LSILTTFSRITMAFSLIVLPLFALAIGQDNAFYGFMVASAGYVQSVVLLPAGRFSDTRGRGIAILLGGALSGTCLVLIPFTSSTSIILLLYAASGIGTGFVQTSVDTLVADYTQSGQERTKSYGYTTAAATTAAIFGSFFAGYLLDPVAFPYIPQEMLRYAILFWTMGGFRIAAGIFGIYTQRWLIVNDPNGISVGSPNEVMQGKRISDDNTVEPMTRESTTPKQDTETALLFGLTQLMMGFSSGMVIPYLVPWVYAAFNVDPIVLGSVPAIANATLATSTLAVGLFSERIGKLRTISIMYTLAPILMIGIVYSPWFLLMLVFYIARNAVANMNRPAFNSLFMAEIEPSRRGRAFAITRIMWQFPRQTGTLVTAFILAAFGGIVSFGVMIFPLAMLLYPLSVIPMYIATRRNAKYRSSQEMDVEAQV